MPGETMADPTVAWRGASGATYTLYLHPIGTTYQAVAGVYIFCKLAQNGNWDPVYIGEAGDLNERLHTNLYLHHKWPCISRNGATHICSVAVPGPLATREGMETDIRQATANSLCNDQ